MKKISILFILASLLTSQLTAQQQPSSGVSLNTAVDSASYALGIFNGLGLRDHFNSFPGEEINYNALTESLILALKGDLDALKMTQEFAQVYLQSYVMDATVRDAEAAKEEEALFFAENKTRDGVVTTASGLQYKIVEPGEGDSPSIDDKVTIHYMGILTNGTLFDSTYDRGEPLTYGVAQMISGLSEGLLLMKTGSKYVFWIPSKLAYGDQGAPPKIKPNSMLIFEVVLLSFEK